MAAIFLTVSSSLITAIILENRPDEDYSNYTANFLGLTVSVFSSPLFSSIQAEMALMVQPIVECGRLHVFDALAQVFRYHNSERETKDISAHSSILG